MQDIHGTGVALGVPSLAPEEAGEAGWHPSSCRVVFSYAGTGLGRHLPSGHPKLPLQSPIAELCAHRLEDAQDQALPWAARGFARQAVGRMEGGFPLLAAPCRQSTSCCCTLRGHRNARGWRWI